MKTPKVLSLFVLIVHFLHVTAQKNYVYTYTSAASEHEEFILAIENGLHSDANRPVVKTVRLSNGIILEYAEQGNINGTPVVLLHGFLDSRCSYDLVLPHLPASIRAFSLSQRGYGNSDKPEKGYTPKDMAADVAAFLELLNIKQAIVVGHSMGSVVAQQFAIDYPGKTAGIVLTGAFYQFTDKKELVEFQQVIAQLKDPIDTAFTRDFQQSTLVKDIPAPFFNTLINESMKVPARVWKETVNDLMQSNTKKDIEKVKKPAMIVWGTRDAYCPAGDQDALVKAIRGSMLVVYEGHGHAPHWEDPERFSIDLTNFVQSVRIK